MLGINRNSFRITIALTILSNFNKIALLVVFIKIMNTYDGSMLKKSTILNGSIKNLSLFGEIINLTMMSTVNMPKIAYSMFRISLALKLVLTDLIVSTICIEITKSSITTEIP